MPGRLFLFIEYTITLQHIEGSVYLINKGVAYLFKELLLVTVVRVVWMPIVKKVEAFILLAFHNQFKVRSILGHVCCHLVYDGNHVCWWHDDFATLLPISKMPNTKTMTSTA